MKRNSYAGPLQCFCAAENAKLVDPRMNYTLSGYSEAPICKDITLQVLEGYGWTYSAKYLIVMVNYVLRLVLIFLIKFIGYDTETVQTKYIKNSVFVIQFFNTAILALLL